jgi:hypothetical protein
MSKSVCPVCSNPTAPNAPLDDPRCGPCHNFGIIAIDDCVAVLRVDFQTWLATQVKAIEAVDNMSSYQHWIDALQTTYLAAR